MRRTDLALEAREIIEGKEEISGVILEEENKYGNLVKVTKMKIRLMKRKKSSILRRYLNLFNGSRIKIKNEIRTRYRNSHDKA